MKFKSCFSLLLKNEGREKVEEWNLIIVLLIWLFWPFKSQWVFFQSMKYLPHYLFPLKLFYIKSRAAIKFIQFFYEAFKKECHINLRNYFDFFCMKSSVFSSLFIGTPSRIQILYLLWTCWYLKWASCAEGASESLTFSPCNTG